MKHIWKHDVPVANRTDNATFRELPHCTDDPVDFRRRSYHADAREALAQGMRTINRFKRCNTYTKEEKRQEIGKRW